jgi:hypothetical protein
MKFIVFRAILALLAAYPVMITVFFGLNGFPSIVGFAILSISVIYLLFIKDTYDQYQEMKRMEEHIKHIKANLDAIFRIEQYNNKEASILELLPPSEEE